MTASTGYDAQHRRSDERNRIGKTETSPQRDRPCRPEQAKVLAELEQDAKIHLTLV